MNDEAQTIKEMCNRNNLMVEFNIDNDLDKIMTSTRMKEVAPSDKFDIRRAIEMLLDRAFDAGVVNGVALYTTTLLKKQRLGKC